MLSMTDLFEIDLSIITKKIILAAGKGNEAGLKNTFTD